MLSLSLKGVYAKNIFKLISQLQILTALVYSRQLDFIDLYKQRYHIGHTSFSRLLNL